MKKNIIIIFSIFINLVFKNFSFANIENHWNGENYSNNAHLQKIWAQQFFFDNYKFQGNEKVLDIGSGDGIITSKISELSPNGYVIGIDNSESMIAKSQANFKHVDNLKFFKISANDENFYKNHLQRR